MCQWVQNTGYPTSKRINDETCLQKLRFLGAFFLTRSIPWPNIYISQTLPTTSPPGGVELKRGVRGVVAAGHKIFQMGGKQMMGIGTGMYPYFQCGFLGDC